MFVIGGRTNNVGESVPLEVYDTETSEWHKFNALQRFRHCSWVIDHGIYIHGGFEHDTPNIPINSIAFINSELLLAPVEALDTKLKADKLEKDKKKGNKN
jgi:protein phosphatase